MTHGESVPDGRNDLGNRALRNDVQEALLVSTNLGLLREAIQAVGNLVNAVLTSPNPVETYLQCQEILNHHLQAIFTNSEGLRMTPSSLKTRTAQILWSDLKEAFGAFISYRDLDPKFKAVTDSSATRFDICLSKFQYLGEFQDIPRNLHQNDQSNRGQ